MESFGAGVLVGDQQDTDILYRPKKSAEDAEKNPTRNHLLTTWSCSDAPRSISGSHAVGEGSDMRKCWHVAKWMAEGGSKHPLQGQTKRCDGRGHQLTSETVVSSWSYFPEDSIKDPHPRLVESAWSFWASPHEYGVRPKHKGNAKCPQWGP